MSPVNLIEKDDVDKNGEEQKWGLIINGINYN
jgi:hypothetical protein